MRLIRTTSMMRAAAGVAVPIVSHRDDPTIEVALAYCGRAPEPGLSAEALCALGAKVAAALADLHSLGLVHRALAVDHVLVDAAGTVRLCGFGECGPGDGTPDVRAIGDLLDALLDPGDRSPSAATVRAVIARTRADEAPTAAAIAASLAAASAPARIDAPPVTARRPPSIPWRRMGAAVAATVALVLAAIALLSSGGEPTSRAIAEPATSTTTSSTTSTTAPRARRVWPATPVTIQGDGATWRLGDGDDIAVVGAWGCGATATPALVRADGTVWLVPRWTDGERASYVTTIDGEVLDVHVETTATGCDDLVVTTASGTVRPLAGA